MKETLELEKKYVLENLKAYAEYLKGNNFSLFDTQKEVMKTLNKLIEMKNIGSTDLVNEVSKMIHDTYKPPIQNGFHSTILKNLGIEETNPIINKYSNVFSESFSEGFESLRN